MSLLRGVGPEPYIPSIDSYTRSRSYHFVLELDAEGMILGGEWISTNQPDFLWAPTSNCDVRSGWNQPPVVSAANVQTLIDQATGTVPPPPVSGEEHAFNAQLASPVERALRGAAGGVQDQDPGRTLRTSYARKTRTRTHRNSICNKSGK